MRFSLAVARCGHNLPILVGRINRLLTDRLLTPSVRTGASDRAALDRKAIQLYSDMLLHELGPEISGVCGLVAAPTEFRTARLMRLRSRTEYLHDGSAGLPDETIVRHGGEAARARDSYSRLNELGKRVLHRFLRSL